MTDSQEFQEITILIPGHSIEDLPSDLNERKAASLLNAFAIAWHPVLLNRSCGLPHFRQADASSLPPGKRIVIVPECSEDWLAHNWQEQFASGNCVVIHGCSDRGQYLDAIRDHFGHNNTAPLTNSSSEGILTKTQLSDEDRHADDTAPPGRGEAASADTLIAHFLALGTCHLQLMLLSRRMHHFGDPDNYALEKAAFDAARAAMLGDHNRAEEHLRRCFECLLNCREQFYPVNACLLDVCIPADTSSPDELRRLIDDTAPLNLLISGDDLANHCRSTPELVASLRAAASTNRLSLMSGHMFEQRTSLNSAGATYADLEECLRWMKESLNVTDVHWARRRFGIAHSLPAFLHHFRFTSAIHVVLDDGIYPDREHGQMTWQGPDGSEIPASSRIPMAIDAASSFLKFADRMTESMQEDTTAVMFLARLPVIQSPWLNDLKIIAQYAPVLGSFVTMSDLVNRTRDQASPTKHDASEYLSPYLIQSSVLKTESAVSSPAELICQQRQLESASFLKALLQILKPAVPADHRMAALQTSLHLEFAARQKLDVQPQDTPDVQHDRLQVIADQVALLNADLVRSLSQQIPSMPSQANGLLAVNPLPWKRHCRLTWPKGWKLPTASESITGVWEQEKVIHVTAEIPAGGFAWLHEPGSGQKSSLVSKQSGKPLAEKLLLRNQFFEVLLSESTGGISSVTFYNERPNRMSQQVGFRYDIPKTVSVDDEQQSFPYAKTCMVSTKVLQAGPLVGSVRTDGEIRDVVTGKMLATFHQITSVERLRSQLTVEIIFDEPPNPTTGNPWMTYFASRFAWDNESAAITRGLLGQACGFRNERFESPDYVEIADADHRLLVIPHGRPYHRRTSGRTLDSLLIVEGEQCRRFLFTIEFGQMFPMRSALEAQQPPVVLETSGRIPKTSSGWILGISAKNIVVTALPSLPAIDVPSLVGIEADAAEATVGDMGSTSVRLLMQETEGRKADCVVHTARRPASARLRYPDGTTVQKLAVTDQGVRIEFSRFQIKELEITF